MTEIQTSRGTVIRKRIAETVIDTYFLDQLLDAQGEFINLLNEIHRHKGSDVDFDKICNEFVPNVESIILEFQKKITKAIESILPITGDFDDPKITSIDLNTTASIKCTIAPYDEIPVQSVETALTKNTTVDWSKVNA